MKNVSIDKKPGKHFGLIVVLTGIALFLLSIFYFSNKYRSTATDDFIGRNETDLTDILDYHFIATNFAFNNRFPLNGYQMDTGFYKIHSNFETNVIYLNVYQAHGPVITFVRAPLFPLAVGCIYKLWGYKLYLNQRLNILMLSLMIGFLPLVGYAVWGNKGYFSGIAGGLILMAYAPANFLIYTLDNELFVTFIFFIFSSVGLLIKNESRVAFYLIYGLTLGLGMLAKPIVSFIPVVYAAYFFLKLPKPLAMAAVKRLGAMFLGIALMVLPWSIYINEQKNQTRQYNETWGKGVAAELKMPELDSTHTHLQDPLSPLTYFAKLMWIKNVQTDDHLIVTSTPRIGLLLLNNEYSLDGAPLHFEWLFLENSAYHAGYNTISPLRLLVSFFYHHPSYIFLLPIARLNYAANAFPLFYWWAAGLWGVYIIWNSLSYIGIRNKRSLSYMVILLAILCYLGCFVPLKYTAVILFTPLFLIGFFLFKIDLEQQLSMAFPLLWLGIFFFLFFISGEGRFSNTLLPICCLSGVYYTLLLVKDLSLFLVADIKGKN